MKKIFSIILVLVLTLFAIGTVFAQRDPSTPGWPPATVLTEYGLVGMTMPNEMRSISWNVETDSMLVHIRFSGTAATLTAIKNWFTSNDWSLHKDESSGRDTKIRYRKDRVNEEDDPPYFFETEVLFDGSMGYIRAAIDW